jgi:hypothetical protein
VALHGRAGIRDQEAGNLAAMDVYSGLWPFIFAVFVLITLPLIFVAIRLGTLIRIMTRIENLNLRSVQRWGV